MTRTLMHATLALALSAPAAFAQAPGAKPAAPTAKPAAPTAADATSNAIKRGMAEHVDGLAKLAQETVDSVFSFGELGFQEVETSEYLTGVLEKQRLQGDARRFGHPDRLGGHVRQRQARDRPGLRHRRHPAIVAEARRGLPRPDHRGRAGPRRGAQHGRAAQHRRGHRGEARDGAREAARHDHAVARRRRGARRQQGLVHSRRRVQGRRRGAVHARRQQPADVRGARAAATASCRWSTPSRARRRTAPARRGAAAPPSTPWS